MVQNIAKKNSITAILFTHSENFSIDFSISIKEVLNMQYIFQSFPIVKEIKKNLIKKKKNVLWMHFYDINEHNCKI